MGLSSQPIDFKIFKLLVYIDQKKQDRKWSVMELEDFLNKEDITEDVPDPWVFFYPTNKLIQHIDKKLGPKAMRKEIGLFKYLLLKLLMTSVPFDFSKLEKEEIKKILFGFFLDAEDLPKKDKNIFEEEYLHKLWDIPYME